jgi:hypothetical protein
MWLSVTFISTHIANILFFTQALYNAMDEEDSLAHELEREQEAALKSAILEEETWLEELAREQSREVQVDTEPDTEVEEMSLTVRVLLSSSITAVRGLVADKRGVIVTQQIGAA